MSAIHARGRTVAKRKRDEVQLDEHVVRQRLAQPPDMTIRTLFFDLSNEDIKKLCKVLGVHCFRGVGTRDSLNCIQYSKPAGYVINLQARNEGNRQGTHWVTVWCAKGRGGGSDAEAVYYFDSYGRPPPQELFNLARGREVWYDDDWVQHLDSKACGFYCVYMLYQPCVNKRKLGDVIEQDFTTSQQQNEHMLRKWFDKMVDAKDMPRP